MSRFASLGVVLALLFSGALARAETPRTIALPRAAPVALLVDGVKVGSMALPKQPRVERAGRCSSSCTLILSY